MVNDQGSSSAISPQTMIGIVGLGKIGAAIAKNVLASGRPMVGWARRPESLKAFGEHGGHAAESLADLAAAEVVISVVFNDEDLREVAFGSAGLVQIMRPGAVHVAMETISPSLARELHDAHSLRGQSFLAAPVFGRPEAALLGQLAIMCSGPDETFHAVDAILSTAGRTQWIGPEPEQAMLVKLIGNHMILTVGELLAEVFTFLDAGGVGAKTTRSALLDDLMPRVFSGYVQRLADDPGGERPASTSIGRKDTALVIQAARDLGVGLALAHRIQTARG